MESNIKIRASLNQMKHEFDKGNSPYYFIKRYDGSEHYKNDANEPIIFNCLIRHNEIGNRKIESATPYTFETLESTLERKCKEYEEEQKDNELYLIDHILYKHKIYDITLDYDENKNIIAKDDDNVWKGKELYDFLYNEVFVYNNDGTLDLVSDEDLKKLDIFRQKYEESKLKYSLNYEYNEFRMRLFLSNDSGPIYMNEFINYNKWSENRLKYLDEVLDKSINTLIDRCKKAVPNLVIDKDDKINTKLKAKEVITNIVKDNNKKLEDKITKLDISIKNWYIENYPDDELGNTLSSSASFLDLNNLLNSGNGKNVYELLGGDSDTIIRERCFQKLSELTDQSYDDIYNKWLNTEEKVLEVEEEIEK